jgi:hypothetical protein
MPVRRPRIRTIERGRYRTYLKKATEFYETTLQAKERGK